MDLLKGLIAVINCCFPHHHLCIQMVFMLLFLFYLNNRRLWVVHWCLSKANVNNIFTVHLPVLYVILYCWVGLTTTPEMWLETFCIVDIDYGQTLVTVKFRHWWMWTNVIHFFEGGAFWAKLKTKIFCSGQLLPVLVIIAYTWPRSVWFAGSDWL